MIPVILNSLVEPTAVSWSCASHMAVQDQLIISETMTQAPHLQHFATFSGVRSWLALTFMHHSR